jgi:CheY-like chemotaxis protein
VNCFIMIVEDDDDIRSCLTECLEAEDFTVLTASNGRTALEVLKVLNEKPELILLDLMMPVMSGWEFLEVKAQEPQLADIPVVVMSAGANQERLSKSQPFLRKPLGLENLFEVIHQVRAPSGQALSA